jgi:hypothetical protein
MSKESFPAMDLYLVSDSMSLTIESLAVWGTSRLIIGTTEGTLLIFNIEYLQNSK